jgi:hypothetical protein
MWDESHVAWKFIVKQEKLPESYSPWLSQAPIVMESHICGKYFTETLHKAHESITYELL